jgi:hypothetical protein
MLILFDHSTPAPLFSYLAGHTVIEAKDKGWDRLSNGDLLAEAERAGFDLFVTADNSIAYQQNLKGRKIAILLINRNSWRLVQRVIRKIVLAVNAAEPGSYAVIDVPGR